MQMPLKFTTVKQPGSSRVCGAACCAMAVGKTLEQVMEEYDWKEMTHVSGMARYLVRHGVTIGLFFDGNSDPPFPNPFRIMVTPQGRPAILAVKSAVYEKADHWIFWDGKQIRDPSPREQEAYNILEIHFLTYWPEPEWIPELTDAKWWELADNAKA